MGNKKNVIKEMDDLGNKLFDIRNRYEAMHGRDLLIENIEIRLAQVKKVIDLIEKLY